MTRDAEGPCPSHWERRGQSRVEPALLTSSALQLPGRPSLNDRAQPLSPAAPSQAPGPLVGGSAAGRGVLGPPPPVKPSAQPRPGPQARRPRLAPRLASAGRPQRASGRTGRRASIGPAPTPGCRPAGRGGRSRGCEGWGASGGARAVRLASCCGGGKVRGGAARGAGRGREPGTKVWGWRPSDARVWGTLGWRGERQGERRFWGPPSRVLEGMMEGPRLCGGGTSARLWSVKQCGC